MANLNKIYKVPFEVWLGTLDGTGNNNPQWIDRPNYAGRFTMEPLKNFRLAGNLYQGSTLTEKNLNMYGGEMRYQTGKLLIESEYINRHYTDTVASSQNEYGFYMHSYYNFFTGAKMIQVISPVFKWDFMGNESENIDKTAERITAGVNFGFEPKQFQAEIRLNYEKYLKKYYATHFEKFTVEFIARF